MKMNCCCSTQNNVKRLENAGRETIIYFSEKSTDDITLKIYAGGQ